MTDSIWNCIINLDYFCMKHHMKSHETYAINDDTFDLNVNPVKTSHPKWFCCTQQGCLTIDRKLCWERFVSLQCVIVSRWKWHLNSYPWSELLGSKREKDLCVTRSKRDISHFSGSLCCWLRELEWYPKRKGPLIWHLAFGCEEKQYFSRQWPHISVLSANPFEDWDRENGEFELIKNKDESVLGRAVHGRQ